MFMGRITEPKERMSVKSGILKMLNGHEKLVSIKDIDTRYRNGFISENSKGLSGNVIPDV
jgi:hypothetical protein